MKTHSSLTTISDNATFLGKAIIFTACVLAAMSAATAQTVTTATVGDLIYTLNSPAAGEATITNTAFTKQKGFNESYFYSGVTQYDIVIPATIEVDGTTYEVTAIGDNAFNSGYEMDNYFNNIRSITFVEPSYIESIPADAFMGCNLAGSDGEGSVVKLPASVKTIGAAAFTWTYAKEYDLSNTQVTKLNDATFYDIDCKCTIKLPQNLESIGDWCFGWAQVQKFCYYDDNGEEVENPFPPKIKTVGKYAITSNYSLKKVTIPSTVESWGEGTFWRCRKMENITVDPNNTTLKSGTGKDMGVLFSKDGTILYSFPQNDTSMSKQRFQYKVPVSVTRIGNGAFGFCGSSASISKVVLPANLEEIGDLAFNGYFWGSNNRFKTLTIPAKVNKLGYGCLPDGATEVVLLGDCSNLLSKATTSLTTSVAGITNSGMGGGLGSIKFYVKKSLYNTYKNNTTISNSIKNRISYKIPLTPAKKITSFCRDFDINLVDADDDDLGSDNPLKMYIATEKHDTGMTGDGTAGEDGKFYQYFMEMAPITYVPSRTGDDNDDYTGVVVKVDDTSETYYYEIGENDCYSGNQTTLNGQTNYLFGAPCYTYVRTDEAEDGSAGSDYKTLGLNNGIFKWYSEDGLVSQMKSFLRLPASIASHSNLKIYLKFNDSETATGIDNAKLSPASGSDVWYTIDGVKLSGKPAARGIYIHNKHKEVVK